MLNGARKIINSCLKVKSKEDLVIVADMPNISVAKIIYQAAKECGAEVSLILMEQRTMHGEDPPIPISYAIKEADVAIFTTVFSLSNSQARIEGSKAGVRIISIPGCSPKVLKKGGIEANFLSLEPFVKKIGKLISVKGKIKLTSKNGTDLDIELCGRKSVDQTGICHRPGTWSPFPLIETAVGPRIKGVNGVLLVDGVVIPGGIVKKHIEIIFKYGRIINISGGPDAKKLKNLLESYKDPNVYQCVEFGIGLNPKAKMGQGIMTEDESEYGTVHIGIGQGLTFGLDIKAKAHIDLVLKNPIVEIGGKVILNDRVFRV